MVDIMMKDPWADDEVVTIRKKTKRVLFDSDEEDDVPVEKDGIRSMGDNSGLDYNHTAKSVHVEEDVNYDGSESNSETAELASTNSPHPKPEKEEGNSYQKIKSLFQNKDLYDAESSDEDYNACTDNEKTEEGENHLKRKEIEDCPPVHSKKQKKGKGLSPDHTSKDDEVSIQKIKASVKPAKESKSRKAKTAAKNEINQIHSETQRLIRESRLSLPYHRPKQHSITEFLQRRKTIEPAVKEISLASKNLGLVWKCLEEREKEAEIFYKSESEDSDSENTITNVEKCNQVLDAKNAVCDPKGDVCGPNADLCDTKSEAHNAENKVCDAESKVCDAESKVCDAMVEVCEINKDESAYISNIISTPSNPDNLQDFQDRELGKEPSQQLEPFPKDNTNENNLTTDASAEGTKQPTGTEKTLFSVQNLSGTLMNGDPTDYVTTFSSFRSEDDNDNAVDCDKEGNRKENKSLESSEMISDDNARDSMMQDPGLEYSENFSMFKRCNLGSQDLVLHFTATDTSDMCNNTKVMSEELKTCDNTSICGSEMNNAENQCEKREDQDNCKTLEPIAQPLECEKEGSGSVLSPVHAEVLEDKTTQKECAKSDIPEDTKAEDSNVCGQPDDREICTADNPSGNYLSGKHEPSISNKLERLKLQNRFPKLSSQICSIKPKLKGDPDEIIDLNATVVKPQSGVQQLIQRFMKHSAPKKTPVNNKKLEVSVSSVEKSENGEENLVKEILTVPLDEEQPENPELSKPGAKLLKLKEELQQKMARHREEEWLKRKQEHKIDNEEEVEDEKSDCGILDDAAEESMTESESEEEEEEEEEMPIKEKKRVKNKFLDDEAEVSDDDCDENYDGDDDEDHVENSEADDEDDNISNENDTELCKKNTDDISKIEAINDSLCKADGQLEKERKPTKLKRIMTHDMFESDESSQEDNGDADGANTSAISNLTIPPYQPGGAHSQISQLTQEKLCTPSSSLEFIPETQQLLGTSTIGGCSSSSIFGVLPDSANSQPCKKLFTSESYDSQKNMNELMGFCSGDFQITGNKKSNILTPREPDIETDLIDLCSGKFTTQPVSMRSLEKDEFKDEIVDFDDTQKLGSTQEAKLIFSKDFSLPTTGPSQLSQDQKNSVEKPLTDEEDSLQDETSTVRKRKKNKKLNFSDDEETEGDEDDRLSSGEESDEDRSTMNDEKDMADYDSEENEVYELEKPSKKKVSANEFFEDEAELSESEWGSEDEDEKDLDNFEWEEGDAENVDQKKLKEQLDKIHMRQVLDDDQREVRLLQELLLEDGELHSEGGRERKFRWKNMSLTDENDQSKKDSDGEDGLGYDGNEEDEAEWRKERFEREAFLMEQKEKAAAAGKVDDEFFEDNSQLLKLGKAALERIRRSNSHELPESLNIPKKCSDNLQVSPNPKHPFQLLTKRGSFLARSETSLARIAQITDGASINSTVITSKNSRNFVFATLSPEKVVNAEEVTTTQKVLKRKSVGATPFLVKKLKLSEEKGTKSVKCLLDQLESSQIKS